jgi:hypothetical protein
MIKISMGLKFEIFLLDEKREDSHPSLSNYSRLFFTHEGFNEIDIIFDEVTTVQAMLERSFPDPFLQIPVKLHDPRLD